MSVFTQRAPERMIVSGDVDDLPLLVADAVDAGMRVCDLFASGDRDGGGSVRLHLLFSSPLRHQWREFDVALGDDRIAPSLTRQFPLLGWYERELAEQFGITPAGHPNLARLTAPVDAIPQLAEAPPGVVDYPLGPVRSGVVESAHYTLRTVGEELVDCALQLFYKHRRVEQRAEGLPLAQATLIAERVSGTSAFNNALAFVQAVETAAALEIPARARFLRTLFAELERVYNHLGALADLAQATGLAVAQAQFEILREHHLRLHAALTGHRYLFGVNVVGGVAIDLDGGSLARIRERCAATRGALAALEELYLRTPSHVDRLEGTGILTTGDARDFGAVGPIARASGIERDLRSDHPYAAYDAVDFGVPLETGGDAMARTRVRFAELRESIRIVEQVCDALPPGRARVEAVAPAPGSSALGWAESTHGETLTWIAVGADGTLRRYRVRPASYANWQAFPLAVPGHNILTDFPVIEQSFNLSVAGADR